MTIEEYIASLNLSDEAKKKATEGLKNFLKDNFKVKIIKIMLSYYS